MSAGAEAGRLGGSVVRVESAEVLPLRTAVFRPLLDGVRPFRVVSDEEPESAHFGLRIGEGEIRGVASFLPESPPDRPTIEGFRIFGFCIAPGLRERGLGARLFSEAFRMHRESVDRRFVAWGWVTGSTIDFWRSFGFRQRPATKQARSKHYVLLSGPSNEIGADPP